MPMQYTAIFHGYKNDKFQMKNYDIFLIFAQNIDRGYTLEPPQVGCKGCNLHGHASMMFNACNFT